jgi:hypothetical protein
MKISKSDEARALEMESHSARLLHNLEDILTQTKELAGGKHNPMFHD